MIIDRYLNNFYNKNIKLDFKIDALTRNFLNFQMSVNEQWKRAMNINYTLDFKNWLVNKINQNENVNISVSGNQRGGKSGVAFSLALDITELELKKGENADFDVNHSFANQLDFLNFLPESKSNNVYIIDEQQQLRAQIGVWVAEESLEDINNITAMECIHQIWVCPDFQARNSEFGLKVLGKNYEYALTRCILFDMKNSEFYTPFANVIIPHFDLSVTKFPPKKLIKMPNENLNKFQILRKEYEIVKAKRVKLIKSRQFGNRVTFRFGLSNKLNKNELFKSCKNITERQEIARYLLPKDLSEMELRIVVKLASNRKLLDKLLSNKKNLGKL